MYTMQQVMSSIQQVSMQLFWFLYNSVVLGLLSMVSSSLTNKSSGQLSSTNVDDVKLVASPHPMKLMVSTPVVRRKSDAKLRVKPSLFIDTTGLAVTGTPAATSTTPVLTVELNSTVQVEASRVPVATVESLSVHQVLAELQPIQLQFQQTSAKVDNYDDQFNAEDMCSGA